MPIYRFKFIEEDYFPDVVVDLPDDDAARHEAVRTATQIMADASFNEVSPAQWRVEVFDLAGKLLFSVSLDAHQ